MSLDTIERPRGGMIKPKISDQCENVVAVSPVLQASQPKNEFKPESRGRPLVYLDDSYLRLLKTL